MSPARRPQSELGAWADWSLIAGLVAVLWGHVVLAATGGGFVLLRDAVSTPRPPLSDAALGLGPQAARAVPQDVKMWALQAGFRAAHLPEALVLPLLVTLALVLLGGAARAWIRAAAPAAGFAIRAPGLVLALWNPYVVERLAQGHWSLLLGVAAAAWIPLFFMTTSATQSPWRTAPALTALIAAAALTPTGLAMAALALAAAGITRIAVDRRAAPRHTRRRPAVLFALGAGAVVVAAAPVALATILGWGAAPAAAGGPGDAAATSTAAVRAGVAAFAARAEPGLGTLGSLAALGGIWNSAAVPGSRSTWWAAAGAVPLLAVWLAGSWIAFRGGAAVPSRAERTGDAPAGEAQHGDFRGQANLRAARCALAAAAAVLVTVAAAATGPGQAALSAAIDAVPALGLLRDGQKWIGLALPGAVVAITLCSRAAADKLAERHDRGRGATRAPNSQTPRRSRRFAPAVGAARVAASLFAAVPVLLVPDAATFLYKQFVPTHYGAGWEQINEILAGDHGGAGGNVLPSGNNDAGEGGSDIGSAEGPTRAAATVLVLPGGSFRATPLWAGGRPVLDPAPRLLHAEVLATGDLNIGGANVPGEGAAARAAERAVLEGRPAADVAALGVDWILDERTSAGARGRAEATLNGAELRYRDSELALWRLPAPGSSAAASAGDRRAVLAAHAAWALALGSSVALWLATPFRDCTRRRGRRDHSRMPAPGLHLR